MMESLTASYSAGKNPEGAFQDACADMINIYGEKADIVRELRWIVERSLQWHEYRQSFNEFCNEKSP